MSQYSALVVVGRAKPGVRLNPYYGDTTTPFGIIDFVVTEVVKGSVKPGDTIDLSVEAGIDARGVVTSDKLSTDVEYLVYLVPQGPKSPQTFTVAGYIAGLYIQRDDGFEKLDEESQYLPERVSLTDAREAARESTVSEPATTE